MLSNHLRAVYRLLILVLVVRDARTKSCAPKQTRLLSNCSVQLTAKDQQRTLAMIVPYAFGNRDDEETSFISLFRHRKTSKAIVRLNLSFIRCPKTRETLPWSSLESSSTLRGEFLRTAKIENNTMYLPAGRIFLKNLTAVDCSTQTLYRTDDREVFELDLKIESTLNDFCSNDHSCQPQVLYQCDPLKRRCSCRQPFQVYALHEQYPICVQTVPTLDQCLHGNIRCVEWCHFNRSSATCLCPPEYAKKLSETNQTFCESQTGGKCNTFLRCPPDDRCLDGTCQNPQHQSHSFDLFTLALFLTPLTLCLITLLVGTSLCLLQRRRRRWKKDYQPPSDSLQKKTALVPAPREILVPQMSDYDNVTYDAFRQNVRLSSSEDNESSPATTSDECSYEPKIIYLGGEQQLTAIFA